MRISSVSLTGRRGKLLRWVAFSAIVGCVLLPTASTAAPTPAVAPPAKSLTSQWWQTFVSVPASDAASRCDLGIGNVVFLGATATGSVSGSCTLSAGTSILLPLINVECSSLEDPPFFGGSPGERLVCAKRFADDFTSLSLTINGVAVGNPSRLRVRSQPFEFSPVNGNIFGIRAGTGGSVTDGYWALIGPLAPGDYDVVASGSYTPFSFTTNITYQSARRVTTRPRPDTQGRARPGAPLTCTPGELALGRRRRRPTGQTARTARERSAAPCAR